MYPHKEWLINDAFFDKVSELRNVLNDKVLFDFIESIYLQKGGKNFAELLNKKDNKYLEENKQIILGYMMIDKSKIRDDTHYIKFIDTLVPKLNLAAFMINKYEKYNEDIILMPREFIKFSIDYWYYKQHYNYCNEDDYMDQLNNDFHIYELKDEIKWDLLYDKLKKELAGYKILFWYRDIKYNYQTKILWKIASYYTSRKYSPENALKYLSLDN